MRTEGNRLHFGNSFAGDLVREFGSPLFVYEECTLRKRCRELKNLIKWDNFRVNYSCKANSNLALMRIVRDEGLTVDAVSMGEVFFALEAGYPSSDILFIPNNVSREEMQYAIDRDVMVSVDSLSQLRYYAELSPGGEVFIRINPGIGEGHHKKVITGGKAKFGIQPDDLPEARRVAAEHGLKITGVNMHIGSFFLTPEKYVSAIEKMLGLAEQFESLRCIDFGGGFGIPYNKVEQARFPMAEFGPQLQAVLRSWQERTGRREITFVLEPGRYPVAECGTILTTVHAIKENFGTTYVGTDLGFNLLMRPVLYDAYHEIVVCDNVSDAQTQAVSVCGNICEAGDLICQGRVLPKVELGNTLAVLDCGAYGFAMSSNYNARLRPAEVLITESGDARLIRRREELEQLLLTQA